MSFSNIIAISGKSGCGNSTVSEKIAKKVNLKLINYTFRTMALEKNMELEKILELAKIDSQYDKNLDNKQIELAKAGNCVIGSRLAIWLIKDADLKIFLTASLEERAKRISKRMASKETAEFTKQRDIQDHKRFLKLYGIDNDDISIADLVINTEKWTADQIVDIIEKSYLSMLKS